MSNNSINGNSALTDILNALDVQGIVSDMPAEFFTDTAFDHELAAFLATKSMFRRDNLKGYVFMTKPGMDEWEDSRHLTIHFGAVDGGDLYDVEMSLWTAINRAGFQTVVAPKSNSSITIHVPKSRF